MRPTGAVSADALHTDYIARVPKVDLHVHLEGAIRPERFVQILRRHGLHPQLRQPADVTWLFQHASFTEFLDHFRFVVTSWRDVQDVHDVALDLFRDLCAQNVAYAEVLFSAAIFVRAGMPWDELLDAVRRAEVTAVGEWRRSRPDAELVPRFRYVLDLVRNFGADFAVQQAEWIAAAAPDGVVGVHLGGDEAAFPARGFVDAFRIAREAGLGVAAHAGEGDGPHSVRDAVELLQVTRVGHGVRSIEDARLVRDLVARGVTLEVCPTSNQRTGVVAAIEQHPLRRFLDAGVRVTIGSDDPSYFDTDTTRELRLVRDTFGVDLDGVDRLVDTGLEASFQSEPERMRLLAAFASQRRALRAALGM